MRTRSRPSPKLALPTARQNDALRLDRQLCFALYATSLTLTKLYKPLLAPLGLTYPQYLVLLTLWEQDGQSVGELGGRLCLDSGTLTPLLKRMETAGWLRRERATHDERRVLVHLTPAGQDLRHRALDVPMQLAGAFQVPLDEVAALTRQLQDFRSRLIDKPSPEGDDPIV